ncbi:MAG: ribonuclease III domain-containing protein [Kiritimatiellia bacterium]
MKRKKQLKEFQKFLKYRFRDPALLDAALTAPSYRGRNPESVKSDNQRLEFLGDAVFGILAAEHVFKKYPHADEGELTLQVTHLANGRSLASLALSLDLHRYLLASAGDEAPGVQKCSARELEDAIEALFGAVWCDGGLKPALKLFKRLIRNVPEMPVERWYGNPKGALQELAQHHAWPDSPLYTLLDSSGPDHNPSYTMRASVHGGFHADFTAGTKRAAETGAADALIRILKEEGFEV